MSPKKPRPCVTAAVGARQLKAPLYSKTINTEQRPNLQSFTDFGVVSI